MPDTLFFLVLKGYEYFYDWILISKLEYLNDEFKHMLILMHIFLNGNLILRLK